jgi:hypothetical protein
MREADKGPKILNFHKKFIKSCHNQGESLLNGKEIA